MKPINEMRLRIESRSVNEAFARAAVAAFVSQLDPTLEEISDIKTAVSEAVTNCIVHAYADSVGQIYIWAGLYEDCGVRIKIRDTGCGIEDVKKPWSRFTRPSARSGRVSASPSWRASATGWACAPHRARAPR